MTATAPAMPVRGAVLLVASAALAAILDRAGLPAGLLLGPMVVGIVLGVRGWSIPIPDFAFRAAQAIVGCLIAAAINRGIVDTMAAHLLLFVGTTAATLAASVAIGWLSTRWQVLPGTVAIWGSMPGAATAMVLMARSFGADPRLVAVMTYSRVVCVAVVASVLAAALTRHGGSGGAAGPPWFPAIDPFGLAETIVLAATGALLASMLRIPAGALLGPIALGAAANVAGLVHLALPGWLLAPAYAIVGWRIGLGFTRDIVQAAARALPRILLATVVLIGFCGGLGALLAHFARVDSVTAYLATSPGGMDSVAIIAASTPVDTPFVMAMQMLRFLAVLFVGPALARVLARSHATQMKEPTS